jgi:ankyrin repeat protein
MQVPYAVRRKWLHVRLTALTWAATCGHKHVVEKLIATGVNLDTKANSGYDRGLYRCNAQAPSNPGEISAAGGLRSCGQP